MNADLSLSTISAPLKLFFGKYHATVFFTVVILLLAAAIFTLYSSIQQDEVAADPATITSTTFDTTTAKKIQTLRESNQSTKDLVLPSPRQNPFVE